MSTAARYNTYAWVTLVAMVMIHVLDEALTDFLPLYNEIVYRLRDQLGFFPAPTFTFPIWITGMSAALMVGYALTPWIARGGATMRIVSMIAGILMLGNATAHLAGSVYLNRPLLGVWSSPFLLAASCWVVARGVFGRWSGFSGHGPGEA